MNIVFEDWVRDGESVYISEPELSIGSLHSGSTFGVIVNFTKDEIETIAEAKKKGVEPVFRLVE